MWNYKKEFTHWFFFLQSHPQDELSMPTFFPRQNQSYPVNNPEQHAVHMCWCNTVIVAQSARPGHTTLSQESTLKQTLKKGDCNTKQAQVCMCTVTDTNCVVSINYKSFSVGQTLVAKVTWGLRQKINTFLTVSVLEPIDGWCQAGNVQWVYRELHHYKIIKDV